MKILFTADIHIKIGQKNVPADWAKSRYNALFTKLAELSANVDLTILGGDIFDKVPNMEELELYYDLVESIKSKCYIYSGNHEAIKKNTTFLTNLKKVTSRINNKVEIIDDFWSGNGIDIIPYNKLKEWEKDPDNTFYSLHNRILCTHVRGEIPPHVKPEVNLELFAKWKVVLAGDLHSHDNCQRNILYPGSPVTTSFHRNRVDTGVILIDSDTLDFRWVGLDLPQLIRKTVKAGEPMPPGTFDHVVYEVEGDVSELSMVEGNELIDKKVVRRISDIALILDAEMTLADEVREYLLYIMQLEEEKVKELLMEFSAYVDRE